MILLNSTGKTMLANAIAGELKLPFFSVTGTELISGFSGESEHNIRSLFRQVCDSGVIVQCYVVTGYRMLRQRTVRWWTVPLRMVRRRNFIKGEITAIMQIRLNFL